MGSIRLFALCLCVLGSTLATADVERPVVTLDLTGTEVSVLTHRTVNGMEVCHSNNEWTVAGVSGCVADPSTHTASRLRTCPVLHSNATSCPLPQARAYDHHEGDLSVQTSLKLYLKSDPGATGMSVSNQVVGALDYSQRGEYLFSFDAVDSAGNTAETINYVIQLNDVVPPGLTSANWESALPAAIEACVNGNQYYEIWDRAIHGVTAADEYDGDVTSTVGCKIVDQADTRTNANFQIDTQVLGVHQVEMSAHDFASIFGQDGENNVGKRFVNITVQDSTPPEVFCAPQGIVTSPGAFPRNLDFVKSVATHSVDQCSQECFKQDWQSFESKDRCAFFEFEGERSGAVGMNNTELAPMGVCRMYNESVASLWGQFAEHGEDLGLYGANSYLVQGYGIGCELVSLGQTGVFVNHRKTLECGSSWIDPGAVCMDAHDSMDAHGVYSSHRLQASVTDPVNIHQAATYQVQYTCTDEQGNSASSNRTIQVVDPDKPQLIIHGDFPLQYQFQASDGDQSALLNKTAALTALMQPNDDDGFTCFDTCEGDMSQQVTTTISEDDCSGTFQCYNDEGALTACDNGNSYQTPATVAEMVERPGVYAIKYTCRDGSNNEVARCRTVFTDEGVNPPWELDAAVLELDAVANTAKMHAETGGGFLSRDELNHHVIAALPFGVAEVFATTTHTSTATETVFDIDVSVAASLCGAQCRSSTTGMLVTAAHSICDVYKGIVTHVVIPGDQVIHCPVDCQLSNWGQWDNCSSPCGPGVETRARTILTPAGYDGAACPASPDELSETRSCNVDHKCPVDCQHNWMEWGECSESCGGGYQVREVAVTCDAAHGGAECPHAEERTCNTHTCPIDCEMSWWGAWSSCTGSCGGGSRTRSRTISQQPFHRGVACGPTNEASACGMPSCPVLCIPAEAWGEWSSCSNACGNGMQQRVRGIEQHAANGGPECLSTALTASRACEIGEAGAACTESCVSGTTWGDWGPCSATCNVGIETRSAISVPGTTSCPNEEQRPCYAGVQCPVDCVPGIWTEWGDCRTPGTGELVTCGTGSHTRTRGILRQKQGAGAACAQVENQWCETQACPVDCDQTSWSDWSDCSRNCGSGLRTRDRSTIRHTRNGGAPCEQTFEVESCNSQDCLLNCGYVWGNWNTCTATCGGGMQTRKASVQREAQAGGNACPVVQQRSCNQDDCPINCAMNAWAGWGPCSKSCGTGAVRSRERTVGVAAQYGGEACSTSTMSISCDVVACAVDCTTSIWSSYSACSAGSCAGIKSRTRSIIQPPLHGGMACGATKQNTNCDSASCPSYCRETAQQVLLDWGACSVLCGGGVQTRSVNPAVPAATVAAYQQAGCGELSHTCHSFACPAPEDCVTAAWSEWTACTATCGTTGIQMRTTRIMQDSVHGGSSCGALQQARDCHRHDCPVDCIVDVFSDWTVCPETCSSAGEDGFTQTRERAVLLEPSPDGIPCPVSTQSRECGLDGCPVDCEYLWSQWTGCEKTCGSGKQHRQAVVSRNSMFDGNECPEHESMDCNTHACPIDCTMSDWTAWNACSATCGSATQTKTRTVVTESQFGGIQCSPMLVVEVDCSQRCPTDCEVGNFTDWSACSATCGGGVQNRWRSVLDQPVHGGAVCPSTHETQSCSTAPCPVDCQTVAYGEWRSCSATCGTGEKIRDRTFASAANGGQICPASHEVESCLVVECPVDCEVGDWAGWGDCSVTCGGGQEERTRPVLTAMAHHGTACLSTSSFRSCGMDHCAVDCTVGPWSTWGICSQTCRTSTAIAAGEHMRSRQVLIPMLHAGTGCPAVNETQACGSNICPVDCVMAADWSSWDNCDRSCGGGTETRTRAIASESNYGGAECTATEETQVCPNEECPIDCVVSEFSQWTSCSVTCGVGTAVEYRSIDVPVEFGGQPCPALNRTRSCLHETACPDYDSLIISGLAQRCIVTDFAAWSECSTSCGSGYKVRERTIIQQASAGVSVSCPQTIDVALCNTFDCPIDCVVADWNAWDACSVSCGGGATTRYRGVDTYTVGLGARCPPFHETSTCEDQNCPIDCTVTEWQSTACSRTCGGGTIRQWRSISVDPSFDGEPCPAPMEARVPCPEPISPCPTDCVVGPYSDFTSCTHTCGGGTKIRRRSIDVPVAYGGSECPVLEAGVVCNTHACNHADCELTSWSNWTTCTKSCASTTPGYQTRERSIISEGLDYGTSCDAILEGDGGRENGLSEVRTCNLGVCPVNCVVSEFTGWSACDVTCGTGSHTRTRTIESNAAEGYVCPETSETEDCNDSVCPTDCVVGDWSGFGDCLVTCGEGLQTRQRTLTPPENGGAGCPTETISSQACSVTDCPVDCVLEAFSNWTSCSATCEGGMSQRTRGVNRSPSFGGVACEATLEEVSCNTDVTCPVDCVAGDWGAYDPCLQTCGLRFQIRTREILRNASHLGEACPTELTQRLACGLPPCANDCIQADWGSWTTCSQTCKSSFAVGLRTRSRTTNREPNLGGEPCGSNLQSETCATARCPVDCAVTQWGDFSPCSVTCGDGAETRVRDVVHENSYGGQTCPVLSDTRSCHDTHLHTECAIHCEVSEWGEFSPCPVSCGTSALSIRNRTIVQVSAYGGHACPTLSEDEPCGVGACPVDCEMSDWSNFSTCSTTCGTGDTFHTRTITIASAHGGIECTPTEEQKSCNQQPCPVDCAEGSWMGWSGCSDSCGEFGSQTRTRGIIAEVEHGGAICGATHLTRSCNSDTPCPIDCVPAPWGNWTACNSLCGGGERTKTRSIATQAELGGRNCSSAELFEREDCNLEPCGVDCVPGDWQAWTECSATCGNGWRYATRPVITHAVSSGSPCGSLERQEGCNMDHCAVDCDVTAWGAWTSCTSTCGGGSRSRQRGVNVQTIAGGKSCPTLLLTESCGTQICAVDCIMDEYAEWSLCSHQCGEGWGSMTRTRTVVHIAAYGGLPCSAVAAEEEQPCNVGPCITGLAFDTNVSTPCTRGAWNVWSACTKSCGTGTKVRTRASDSGHCPSPMQSTQTANCAVKLCPSDCVAFPWSNWTDCSRTCGGGRKHRTREIQVPAQYGGRCGSIFDEVDCGSSHCPVDCEVLPHETWGECSQTCGTGSRTRAMSVARSAAFGGQACDSLQLTQNCNNAPCPIDCVVGHFMASLTQVTELHTIRIAHLWSDYGPCSAPCGGGEKWRTRDIHVPPSHGGKLCPQLSEVVACNTEACTNQHATSSTWSVACQLGSWSVWSPCNAECGSGVQSRARPTLKAATNGGAACSGDVVQDRVCNADACPGDCQLSAWGHWQPCSSTCGGGVQLRYRSVLRDAIAPGMACPDVSVPDTRNCNHDMRCPVDCGMGDWAAWGECDVSCGGHRTRARTIHTPSMYDGQVCFATEETETCNSIVCPVDCAVGTWEDFSQCSVSCGTGSMSRTRIVLTQPVATGLACDETFEQTDCVTVPCAVDCVESAWSSWGDCHSACGPGIRRRVRFVESEAQYNGLDCGSLEHIIDCDSGIPCPSTCESEWGVWSDCSQLCGLNGVQSRSLATQMEPCVGGQFCPTNQLRSCSPAIPGCVETTVPPLPPAPTPPPSVPTPAPQPRPVLTLSGGENLIVEASLTYTDPGAICIDPIDGDISALIGVSGTIDGRTVGRYVLTYFCANRNGVNAHPMRRVITVQDTYCPHCSFASGETSLTIEASFPFTPESINCTDASETPEVLDASVTQFGAVDVERTGVYRVTYRVKDFNGNWNDGNCIGKQPYVKTVTVADTLKPVIGLSYSGSVLDVSLSGNVAEVSPVTNQMNPIHARVQAGDFLAGAEDSMTRRLLTQSSAPSKSWWAIGVASGAIGCVLVGAALLQQAPKTGWRGADDIKALV